MSIRGIAAEHTSSSSGGSSALSILLANSCWWSRGAPVGAAWGRIWALCRRSEMPSGPRPRPVLNSPAVSLSVKDAVAPKGRGCDRWYHALPPVVLTESAEDPEWLTPVGSFCGRAERASDGRRAPFLASRIAGAQAPERDGTVPRPPLPRHVKARRAGRRASCRGGLCQGTRREARVRSPGAAGGRRHRAGAHGNRFCIRSSSSS
jgi:hypothetical protein